MEDRHKEKRDRIERSCVFVYKPEKCYNGYTLFSNYRGNLFYLMEMNGNIVHTWFVRTAKIGELRPNGNLLYANMWQGMAEVDWHSRELWYYPCTQHHDFCLMPNGHIMILCSKREKPNPSIYEPRSFISAFFIELDLETKEIVWRWDADKHIEELKKAGVKFPRPIPDVYHSNTCEVLPETRLGRKDSRFKAGNVVFCHRNLDVVGVIDKETGEIVWTWGVNELDYPHMPTLIPDKHPITGEDMPGAGHFLIFDNGFHRGYSRVLEVDPLTDEIVWKYVAPNPTDFFGQQLGGQDRMPNGNTVICEGGYNLGGRLFEVTPEGEIVWEYITPYFGNKTHVGINHSIYRCVRYPPEYVEPILDKYRELEK